MEEIHDFMHAHPFCVHPPIEYIVATDDDVLLSPTQEEVTEFIVFLMYKELDACL
ncbi:D-arabinono-1,4-lactone oxidase [Sporosarcina sp. FA15]|uniref:D-arabinono-1,4-lactone oxidase n=1 Tax=Sporosarcina sp. FA15 TaxID=3413031 RepID=UPI003F65B400